MITSKTNETIKWIKSLQQKKYREEYHAYFVEGIKMVKEAIAEHVFIRKIIICKELLCEEIDVSGYEVEEVSVAVFDFISDTDTPQGILAVIAMPPYKEMEGDTIFALDHLQDPGNLGTIIRTLDCAGVQTLLLSEDTVDVYNPKVIRSTMGAIFRVHTVRCISICEKLKELQSNGYQVVVTDLSATQYHYQLDYTQKLAIVIGNESQGVSEEVKAMADIKIKIPMLGRTESLNAGVAASIIVYERVRQML